MTDPVPSKERVPGPQDPRPPGCRCGDQFDPKCPAGHSREQRPSKDQVSQAWDDLSRLVEFAYAQGFHELGYSPLNAIDTAMAEARRENARWENAHKILIADNDRLRRQVGELSIHAEKWVRRALGSEHPWYGGQVNEAAVKQIVELRREAGATPEPPADGDCRSCRDGQCTTGPECVTLSNPVAPK